MWNTPTTPISPDQYVGEGKGLAKVIDLTPLREQQKLAEIRADRHAKEQEHLEQMRQQKLEAQLTKIHNGIRDADREPIANKVKDYQALVESNIEGYRKGDVKAVLAMDEGLRSLNSTIDGSNDLAKKEAYVNYLLEKPNANYRDDTAWRNSLKTPYADKGNFSDYYQYVPQSNYDYATDAHNSVIKPAIGSGDIKTTTHIDPNTGLAVVESYQTDNIDKINAGKGIRFDNNHLAQNQIAYEMSRPENADVVKEKYTLPNGALNFKQYYIDHTPQPNVIQKVTTKGVHHETAGERKDRVEGTGKVTWAENDDGTATVSVNAIKGEGNKDPVIPTLLTKDETKAGVPDNVSPADGQIHLVNNNNGNVSAYVYYRDPLNTKEFDAATRTIAASDKIINDPDVYSGDIKKAALAERHKAELKQIALNSALLKVKVDGTKAQENADISTSDLSEIWKRAGEGETEFDTKGNYKVKAIHKGKAQSGEKVIAPKHSMK
jgi:hypothetical protein